MKKVTILDGGMGRELKRIGAPFSQPLWSAQALIEAPHFVARAHQGFIDAGAEIITVNSYTCVPFHLGEERYESQGALLAEQAALIAKEVAQNAKQNVLVAGSLPPAFGSYRPELFESERAFTILDTLYKAQDEHVNLWIGETISSIEEAHVMASVLKGSNKPCYYAFTLTDVISEQATLRSGELVSDAVTALLQQNVAGIFFNCSIPEVIEQAFSDTNTVLAKQNKSVVLGAFANGFTPIARDYKANEGSQAYRDISPSEYLDFAKKWHSQGASIIGGCCGIGPEFIEVLVSWKKELESA
ncbi:homocysteine S-methyltransferase family protein [Pseudoalteromonas sp. SR45-5]|uniref:homocysteine S-methyltransferase family protein n=1 Tax=Pseudoalteromonas sp. SR45-5 TaxID=2760928 RepID=UPI0015F7F7C8|nr:homocysteine S-methyltransferase family protein [Pseudoalteromonas sp. SR45-5]MBB1354186.1 homocysteine S-methyltransferase family protein [Pseudoalteromonas sp. SR45-5]